jgi:hypothetical protein
MAKLQITGRVIALSNVQEIPSSEAGKPAMKKRELYLDMTMYDPYTGERSERENKPLLEFGGDKVIEKLGALNLQKDDVVTVSFAIQGTPYKDKQTGKMKVYTGIRCYDIEVIRRAGQSVKVQQPEIQPQTQQAAPAPAPQTVQQTPQNQGQQQSNGGNDNILPF